MLFLKFNSKSLRYVLDYDSKTVTSPSRVESPLGGVARLSQVESHWQHQDDPTSDEGNGLPQLSLLRKLLSIAHPFCLFFVKGLVNQDVSKEFDTFLQLS